MSFGKVGTQTVVAALRAIGGKLKGVFHHLLPACRLQILKIVELDVAGYQLMYQSCYEPCLPSQMIVGAASERHIGLIHAFVDCGMTLGIDVDIGWAVEFDVIVIYFITILIGEHVVDVLVVIDDNVRHLKVLENIRHHLGEIELGAMLETRQIYYYRLTLGSIAQQVEESLALRGVDGIIRAKEHDIVLVDARPYHAETVGGILSIIHYFVGRVFMPFGVLSFKPFAVPVMILI